MAKKNYTAFGIYSDSQQPWTHSVEATSPRAAAMKAIEELYNDGKGGGELEDIFVVDVVEGTHQSLLNNSVVVSLKDLKDKDCPFFN